MRARTPPSQSPVSLAALLLLWRYLFRPLFSRFLVPVSFAAPPSTPAMSSVTCSLYLVTPLWWA